MKRGSLLFVAALVLCLASCGGFGPPLDPPQGLDVAVGHEALTVTWSPVAGATGYNVYYTDDGTTATAASAFATTTTGTVFVHESLDPDTTYSYAVTAAVDGRLSAASVTEPVAPELCLRLNVTFAGYASSPAGAMVVECDADGAVIDYAAAAGETTAADGSVAFCFGIFRGRYWGYTVFQDTDASGTMSAGDLVWGSNPAGYSFKWWLTARTTSTEATVDWDTAMASSVTYTGVTLTP